MKLGKRLGKSPPQINEPRWAGLVEGLAVNYFWRTVPRGRRRLAGTETGASDAGVTGLGAKVGIASSLPLALGGCEGVLQPARAATRAVRNKLRAMVDRCRVRSL